MNLVKISQSRVRRGRGIAAGQGKTAGRGTKGQNSRSGHKRYRGFTSGSLPYAQRLPKITGNRPVRRHLTVTTRQIDRCLPLKGATPVINRDWLVSHGLIPKNISPQVKVKIVKQGSQSIPYNLDGAVAASKSVQRSAAQ